MTKDGMGSGNSEDLIGYKALSEAALKGVMREALRFAAKGESLPGGHHFYITFKTAAPGISMADAIKDRFPEEMTIVVQHQYWDLEVNDDNFEIVLKFGGVPQHLVIPYAAVTRFFDPSVNYGLVFEMGTTALIEGGQQIEFGDDTTEIAEAVSEEKSDKDKSEGEAEGTVVSLDAFRRK
ncbi:SspB family protein [Hirschia baltica]|uniref:Stringent starvation protein B n=1 Tax=Hirschia baltica (strain ATCC 49814 / DSM 5838 / IFAM 1418) TaxID=582402 RepID=C6XMX6_HIRBI|nr:ClpXP protease specificity-enhancing factor SspB [Hirschia baltica]ACT58146.1 protein of unknown function DUF1321 [Hirschia baltica ATCC 49814]